MHLGLTNFFTADSADVRDVARAAEESGFESLWVPEHTHIPVSRRSPYPGGGELPREYASTLDPFVALTAAAAVTTTLRLGTGVCLVVERDPITLAKEVASLDLLSGGRFLFGIGGGWNLEEMANHGTEPRTRWRLLRERVLAMKRIWTEDEAEYHGRFVDFDPIWSWPKPAQRPHPPIIIGGDGDHTLERVVEYGDEWMPIAGRRETPLPERIAELNALAAAAGRGPIPVTVFWARPDQGALERYAEAGVHRCIFALPSQGREATLERIQRWGDLTRTVA